MAHEVDKMVRALVDSFESVQRPGFDDGDTDRQRVHERARLYERTHQAINIARHKIQEGDSISHELNVIVCAMGLFGGKEAEDVRAMAATLGASLGVRFPSLAA